MIHDNGINQGVDFERALEHLHRAAGEIFRHYWAAKRGNGSEEEIARLRQAYIDAQAKAEALSRHDKAAIQAVLDTPL